MATNKEVTVFSKPSCVQCTATKRWLDENGFKDQWIDGDAIENVDAIKNVIGYSQAPVVKVFNTDTQETVFWSGFNRDLLIKHLSA